MTTATQRTARAMLVDLVDCDKKDLIKRTTKDETRLTFGLVTPEQFWAQPDKGHYKQLAAALTQTSPGYDKASKDYVWPRVASEHGYKDPRAWDEAVRAGLITAKEARRAQRAGEGYLGWRMFINTDGSVTAIVSGD